jgi:serine/threonine-protein kinase RsbW
VSEYTAWRQLEWKFPATLQYVELVCSAVAQSAANFPLKAQDRFAIDLLTREALNNAVIHGCHQDPRLSFSCHLIISAQEVVIDVLDEGTGFDWQHTPAFPPNKTDETGRGLAIYAIYAHAVKFNDAGNGVTLTRILDAQQHSQGEQDD